MLAHTAEPTGTDDPPFSRWMTLKPDHDANWIAELCGARRFSTSHMTEWASRSDRAR